MLKLSNGAKVHAAYIVPASPGMKANGAVLAETETDWVAWTIYWDGEVMTGAHGEVDIHEVWECENGHYITKSSYPNAGRLAELQFGRMVARLMRGATLEGAKQL